MDNLVVMKNKEAVTTSLKVAETFSKNHRDVMKKIKNLTAQNCAVKNMFKESTYKNNRNQSQPMYFMNRDGFTLLAVGFTGSKAMDFKLKYIQAFNQMEQEIKQNGGFEVPSNMADALQLAANQARQIDELKPKAQFADAVSDSKNAILIGDLAKLISQNGVKIGQKRLFEWLRNNDYLIKRNALDHNMPKQKYVEQHLFIIKEHVVGTSVFKTPMVTGKGQRY
ncbi:Rha family transcriptional regulator, partial [Fructilactobacillus florum]